MFPLKLGKRGKYRALVYEYRTKLSEFCIKDYVNTSPKPWMLIVYLPNEIFWGEHWFILSYDHHKNQARMHILTIVRQTVSINAMS